MEIKFYFFPLVIVARKPATGMRIKKNCKYPQNGLIRVYIELQIQQPLYAIHNPRDQKKKKKRNRNRNRNRNQSPVVVNLYRSLLICMQFTFCIGSTKLWAFWRKRQLQLKYITSVSGFKQPRCKAQWYCVCYPK